MPRLKNVDAEELRNGENAAQDVGGLLADLASRIEKGYFDPATVKEPIQAASSFLALSRTASELAHHLIVKAAIQELQRNVETELRARTGK